MRERKGNYESQAPQIVPVNNANFFGANSSRGTTAAAASSSFLFCSSPFSFFFLHSLPSFIALLTYFSVHLHTFFYYFLFIITSIFFLVCGIFLVTCLTLGLGNISQTLISLTNCQKNYICFLYSFTYIPR